jgi:cation transport regulator ChaC
MTAADTDAAAVNLPVRLRDGGARYSRCVGRDYVFGYGSLLERRADAPLLCELAGYRRTWNVAMDNTRTLPGYKHYVERATGVRGEWFVTFLNIVRDPDATVNGVMFEADTEMLERLDRRERNYDRVEVTAQLSAPADARVWAYVGARVAVERFEHGRRAGRAVISREYLDAVRADFAAAGNDALPRFDELTDPVPCPILDLRRIDHGDDVEVQISPPRASASARRS